MSTMKTGMCDVTNETSVAEARKTLYAVLDAGLVKVLERLRAAVAKEDHKEVVALCLDIADNGDAFSNVLGIIIAGQAMARYRAAGGAVPNDRAEAKALAGRLFPENGPFLTPEELAQADRIKAATNVKPDGEAAVVSRETNTALN